MSRHCHNLRMFRDSTVLAWMKGIDPTPPPNYKIPDLAPVLVW